MPRVASKLLIPKYSALFPHQYKYAMAETAQFNTQLMRATSGAEQRSARWQGSLHRYVIDTGERPLQELQRIMYFFHQQQGRLQPFLWLNWQDYDHTSYPGQSSTDLAPLKKLSSDGQVWGLLKPYTASAGSKEPSYIRRIFVPKKRSIKLFHNTTAISPSKFQIDYNHGAIIFYTAPTYQEGTLKASYQHYWLVRFDTDALELQTLSHTTGRIASIPLMEIRQGERPLREYGIRGA